jgi:cytoskeleton protein RodZ
MSDLGDDPAAPIGVGGLDSLSAGALLRAARERRGLHIAALAASIKVSPRKLEALEADRYAELPDLTFTRALAHTVCRTLKVDAEPVLAKLPHAGDLPKLAHVGGSLNARFRGARGSRDPSDITFHRKPLFWVTLLILLGALALALAPERWMVWRHGAAAAAAAAASSAASPTSITAPSPRGSEPVAAAATTAPLQATSGAASASVAAAPAAQLIETVHSSPQAAQAGSAGPETAGILAVRTSAETWVEVKDARGQMLMSRSVQPGELVGLDGALPLRLIIGNASATQVSFRGKPVDLAASTRDNVARLQLP